MTHYLPAEKKHALRWALFYTFNAAVLTIFLIFGLTMNNRQGWFAITITVVFWIGQVVLAFTNWYRYGELVGEERAK